MGWEALAQWGADVARIERLAGGVANDVWSVRVNGQLAVARRGGRIDADLAWETELLVRLNRAGLTAPVPIPTMNGRLFADSVVVMTYIEGGPPETEADWRRVANALRQLHRLTAGWPQRPGWRSSTDLLHAEAGTRIDLGAMPAEGVARCRAAWARLVGHPTCVAHGNPTNPGNIRITAERVALLAKLARSAFDWDEAHIDVPDLDLELPHNAAGLDEEAHDIAAQASAAWEAAVCWDDEYATPSSGSLKFERSEQQRLHRSLVSTTLAHGEEEKHPISSASFLAKLIAHYARLTAALDQLQLRKAPDTSLHLSLSLVRSFREAMGGISR